MKFDFDEFEKTIADTYKIRKHISRALIIKGLLFFVMEKLERMFFDHFKDENTCISFFESDNNSGYANTRYCLSIVCNQSAKDFFNRDKERIVCIGSFILNYLIQEKQAYVVTYSSEMPGYYIASVNLKTGDESKTVTLVLWRAVGQGSFNLYEVTCVLDAIKDRVEPLLMFNNDLIQRRVRLFGNV